MPKTGNSPNQSGRARTRGSWEKGKSGNPNGRPKVAYEIKELARQYGPEAIETAVKIMRADESDGRTKLAAATFLTDRGYGKPIQATELTGKDGGPIEIGQKTDKELEDRIGQLLADPSLSYLLPK